MDKSLPVPSEEDWKWGKLPQPSPSCQVNHARNRYFGKSTDDVLPYFFNAALSGMEDICYMPPIPFRYYMLAYSKFIMSPELVGDDYRLSSESACGAYTFLTRVRTILTHSPEFILPIMDELIPVARHVAENENLYDPLGSYDSFPAIFADIESIYATKKIV